MNWRGAAPQVWEGFTGQGTDPEMMDILQKFIFGDIYSRGAIDLQTRELLGYCVLTTLEAESQLARDIDRRRHPVPALHRFPCCYQGVAHHQRGICQMTRIKTIFYFRYFLKNASILSNGMMSVLSYKSVWLAPGIISSSLLSPLNLAKASCEAGSE